MPKPEGHRYVVEATRLNSLPRRGAGLHRGWQMALDFNVKGAASLNTRVYVSRKGTAGGEQVNRRGHLGHGASHPRGVPGPAVGGCRTRQCAGAQQRLGALHVAGRSMGSGVSAVGDFRPRIRGAPVVTMGLHGRKRLRGKDSRFGSISPRLRQLSLLKSSTALAKAV